MQSLGAALCIRYPSGVLVSMGVGGIGNKGHYKKLLSQAFDEPMAFWGLD